MLEPLQPTAHTIGIERINSEFIAERLDHCSSLAELRAGHKELVSELAALRASLKGLNVDVKENAKLQATVGAGAAIGEAGLGCDLRRVVAEIDVRVGHLEKVVGSCALSTEMAEAVARLVVPEPLPTTPPMVTPSSLVVAGAAPERCLGTRLLGALAPTGARRRQRVMAALGRFWRGMAAANGSAFTFELTSLPQDRLRPDAVNA